MHIQPVSYRSSPQALEGKNVHTSPVLASGSNPPAFTGSERPPSGFMSRARGVVTAVMITLAAVFGGNVAGQNAASVNNINPAGLVEEVKPYVVADTTIMFKDFPVTFKLLRLNGVNDGFYDAAEMSYTNIDYSRDTIKKQVRKMLTALGYDDKGRYFYMFGQSGDNPSMYRDNEPLRAFFKRAKSMLGTNPTVTILRKL